MKIGGTGDVDKARTGSRGRAASALLGAIAAMMAGKPPTGPGGEDDGGPHVIAIPLPLRVPDLSYVDGVRIVRAETYRRIMESKDFAEPERALARVTFSEEFKGDFHESVVRALIAKADAPDGDHAVLARNFPTHELAAGVVRDDAAYDRFGDKVRAIEQLVDAVSPPPAQEDARPAGATRPDPRDN